MPSCSLSERSGDKDLPWLRIPLHKSSRTGTHSTKTETHRRRQSVDPNRQDESGLIVLKLTFAALSTHLGVASEKALASSGPEMLPSFESMSGSLLRVADQHHVGFTVAADDGELFAVVGVVEVANEFRFKVGELLAGCAIQMLQP